MSDHYGARPLLFLDVDGTLLPYGGAAVPESYDDMEAWSSWQSASNPQLAKVDRGHGPRLLSLPCDLVWATAWMHDANEVISPLLGLPQLPVADLPGEDDERPGALHWKTAALVAHADGRAFAWVDDEITDVDRAWVSEHHAGRALLHRVDALVGLMDADFVAIETWLRAA